MSERNPIITIFALTSSGGCPPSQSTMPGKCHLHQAMKVWKYESMKVWKYESMKSWNYESVKVRKYESPPSQSTLPGKCLSSSSNDKSMKV